ncbi:hypothetical protein K505DRAFT_322652 [Melanomma pulvis-pyrius CBS 109.77]|uniref:Uncharacterized protein n=1 Tax=Melanomma pulvis-pyrius CBS 109.77 TaxID=1314802 RepID=A0A6A6XLR6_9PLEO|nr:hypothetical protein K505DRAFT_322652 [Melanomma pulvis-pyrius CBS 109.77]
MNRTAALREPSTDAQPLIERVDSEQIFHPLAQTNENDSVLNDSNKHVDPPHTKLEKVTAVLKKSFEHHHHHHDHEAKDESETRHEVDRKDKTSENWMG